MSRLARLFILSVVLAWSVVWNGAVMAAPVFQAAGTAVSGTGTVNPAWPAHAIDDVALLFVESTGGQPATLSTPAGFVAVLNSPQATGATTVGTQITVFWARATSAAMTAPTVADPGNHVYARIITYRNVINTGNPWDVTGGGVKAAASTSVTVTGVTTTVPDTLIVQAVARDNDSAAAAFSAQANANLAGIAERSDAGTTSGNGGGFAVWDGIKAAAGATGNTTATVTSSINAFLTIALKPQPPSVVSINRADPDPTNAASVSWTVTFSASVTGVSSSNFTLVNSGLGGTPAITSVTGSGNTRTVTASTGTGSGTLGLNMTNTTGVSPALTNLPFTGQVYTMDGTAPVVSSLARVDPTPTALASVSWTVTFSESVTGVNAADFALVQAGGVSGALITSVTGSGASWTVTASTGTGNGTLGLNLTDDDSIIDSVSNPLGGTGAGNGSFTGEVYTVTRPVAYYHDTTAGVNIGFDGSTNVTSGTNQTIPPIITALLTTANTCTGSARSANHPTGLYTHSRWYLNTNYAVATNIAANPSGSAFLRGGAATDTVIVSLYDYDPTLVTGGGKTLIGSSPVITLTGGTTTTAYPYTISSPIYTVPAGHRLMLEYNFNQPVATYNARVYCSAANAYIAVTETPASTLTCFTDNFNRADGAPAGNWVVANESGSFGNPKIVSNRLRLTDATTSVSTMAALQQLFPAAGNKIIVEFDHFAYNGSGADGIGVVLSDASVAPVPGAFGGSLGYAPKQASQGGDTTHPGFAGGWIGLAIDEYGNFSANTEGRSGGAAPGRTIDSAAVRGSGSGYTGYPYHRGTATLAPGIDVAGATPAPGYRYRIIIDHSNGVNANTSVERDTGTGYVPLIAPYDAKAETGQAAVPTNWFLSFTGSTGASTNIHEVDNLRICSTQPQPLPTLDHIRILHNGQGVTCMPETVTVKTCSNAACDTLYIGAVTTMLNGVTGAINFSGGSTTASVAQTTVGDFTLGASGTSPAPQNAARCFVGATETCTLTFSDAGFSISNAQGGNEVVIPTQGAGITSGSYYLRAVKKNTTTKACEAALTGTSAVNFAYECNNPTTCYANNMMSVNGGSATTIARNNNGSVSSYTPVNMTFDANGNAPFTFNYSDVGMVMLWVNKTVNSALLTGSSNAFVVKPDHFDLSGIQQTAAPNLVNPAALNAVGAKFLKAGEQFSVTVTARNFANAATPNFGKEATPESVKLTSALAAPAGGNNPVVGGTFGSFTNGVATGTTFTWNEVGIITLLPSVASGSYLGAGDVTGTVSANVGRFYPDHFDTAVVATATVPMPCPTGLTCPALYNGFIYSGQPFSVQITARNLAAGTTSNYDGTFGFSKLVTLTAWDALGSVTTQNPGGGAVANGPVAAAIFSAGVATPATPTYTFATALTAPTDIYVRADDTDNVSSRRANPATSIEGGVKIVSGKAKISNAHGSELLDLPMTATVQYYNGTNWLSSVTDSVTSLTLALSNYQSKTGGAWTAAVVPASGQVIAGVLSFKLTKPTGGGTGSVDVSISAPNYLLTGSNGAGVNPSKAGRATFGVFKGNDEFIYLREMY